MTFVIVVVVVVVVYDRGSTEHGDQNNDVGEKLGGLQSSALLFSGIATPAEVASFERRHSFVGKFLSHSVAIFAVIYALNAAE